MEPTKKYTVITGASSGIGRETVKAFANRGKNLIVAARRTENLEALKCEILEQHPTLDVVIRTVDLSVLENVYQFYSSPVVSTTGTPETARLSTHKEHFDISEGSNSLVQQRHAVTSFTCEIPGKNQPPR